MGYSVPLDLIAGSVLTESGTGAPILVGRNRALALSLDVAEVIEAGALDAWIETAGSAKAARWRTLGSFAQVSAAGSSALSLSGADAWVRGAWTLSSGAEMALSLAGVAGTELRAVGAAVAGGTSTPVDVGQYRALRLALEVTSGTGTLTVSVQTAETAAASTWTTVGAFAASTGAGEKLLTVGDLQRFARLSWTLAGGPFTFGVRGTSHLVYASPADRLRFGVRSGAIPDVTSAQMVDALILTAPTITMYLQRREHPLRDWDDALREAHVAAADIELLRSRGAEPGTKGTELYVARYQEWFGEPPQRLGKMDLIAVGKLTPYMVDSAEPDISTGRIGRSVTASRPRRGWEGLR